jgi:hypothetical protein
MKFLQNDTKVNINGKEFDLELFLAVEPNYQVKEGWNRVYQPDKIHILTNGRLSTSQPIDWEDGNRYLTRVSDLIYLKTYLNSEK